MQLEAGKKNMLDWEFGSQRVVNDWNFFPAEVIENPSLNSFKSRFGPFSAYRAIRFAMITMI